MTSFTFEDVKQNANSYWVIYESKVYDLSSFVHDHPGGEEIIREFSGTDITKVLGDETYHVHSSAAYELLEEHYIGDLEGTTDGCLETKRARVPAEKNDFLDLRKPLFPQLCKATYSKAFYLERVHQPRYVADYVPYFSNPWMDLLSRTSWYVVPAVWFPFVVYQCWVSLHVPLGNVVSTCQGFLGGILFWSIFEYLMHRFLFHVDDLMPDHPVVLLLHFTLHGIHHHMPMDRLRLVMPPALTAVLSVPVFKFAHGFFPLHIAHGLVAGTFFGYVCYDMTHYYLHHARVIDWHFNSMKRYHLAHHYKDYRLGFGITSKLWDYVFGTVLVA